jgi:hypothetical protein
MDIHNYSIFHLSPLLFILGSQFWQACEQVSYYRLIIHAAILCGPNLLQPAVISDLAVNSHRNEILIIQFLNPGEQRRSHVLDLEVLEEWLRLLVPSHRAHAREELPRI